MKMRKEGKNEPENDRFTWKESELEIEHPIGSGIFIPMSEFNKILAEEERQREADSVPPMTEEDAGKLI